MAFRLVRAEGATASYQALTKSDEDGEARQTRHQSGISRKTVLMLLQREGGAAHPRNPFQSK